MHCGVTVNERRSMWKGIVCMRERMRRLQQYTEGMLPEFFCLLMMLGLNFLLMTCGNYSLYFIDNYAIMPSLIFFGILLVRKLSPSAKHHLIFSGIVIVWFLVSQVIQFAADYNSRPLGLFLPVILLAFPFAAVAQDGGKQLGLRLAGVIYIGAALVLAGLTGLLFLDLLPGFLRQHILWDGTRLLVMWHPNICASIFMIGIGFCLAFLDLVKNVWGKILLLVTAALFFGLIVLTNSRTTMVMCAGMILAYVFFLLLRKRNWKRLLIALVICLVIAAILLVCINYIQTMHKARLVQEAAEQGLSEKDIVGSTRQKSFFQDLKTFNGRTWIWKVAWEAVQENPSLLFWGTSYSEELMIALTGRSEHMHNAWMETLVCMGIPGLLFAMIMTGLALWKIGCMLVSRRTSMWQIGIALLMLFIMGLAMLEPYLFFTDRYYLYINSLFFLCLGYLIQWRHKLKEN